MFASENENLGVFDSNIDDLPVILFIDSANNQEQGNTDETPSSVKTDEVIVETNETSSVEEKSEVKKTKPKTSLEEPKMIPYNESSLLKELASSIKDSSGIEVPIGEDVNVEDFIRQLSQNLLSKELSNKEAELYGKFKQNLLDEQGIDEDVLAIATGIPYGVNRSEFIELKTIKNFAEQEISLDNEEEMRTLFATYHSLKGLSEEDIDIYTDKDVDLANEELIENRKKHLLSYASKGLKDIEDTIDSRKAARKEFESKRKEDLRKVVNGFIKDKDYTKDQIDSYIKATTEKTEEIKLPDGTVKKVTAFDKKKYEYTVEKFSDALKDNISFWLGSDIKSKEIEDDKKKSKVAGSFMSKYMDDINNKSSFTSESDGSLDEEGFFTVQSKL